ncbi:hypothetical protein B0H17DRAFT_614242 [Mycena rosella]|uniref:Uncharacterized protein n=1 Tax=Mycena rosella TaxID=1033263 RepID=A0AAD7GVJ3_MYCRO|nr:hypothetical protein B0H17DRAFT_614242 [Mycena rosella]
MWQPSGHTRERSREKEQRAKLLHDAFMGKFEGNALNIFCDAMSAYATTFDAKKYYGKIIAWHGPSGAVKSKGVEALKERYPTFTICFRSSDDLRDRWPPGDGPAFNFFRQHARSSTAEERVAAFLGAFLEIAASELQEGVEPVRSAREVWPVRGRATVQRQRTGGSFYPGCKTGGRIFECCVPGYGGRRHRHGRGSPAFPIPLLPSNQNRKLSSRFCMASSGRVFVTSTPKHWSRRCKTSRIASSRWMNAWTYPTSSQLRCEESWRLGAIFPTYGSYYSVRMQRFNCSCRRPRASSPQPVS